MEYLINEHFFILKNNHIHSQLVGLVMTKNGDVTDGRFNVHDRA